MFGNKKEISLSTIAEVLLTQSSALLRVQENVNQFFSALAGRLVADEQSLTEAIIAINEQIKLMQERMQVLESALLDEGKLIKVPESLKTEPKN